MKPKNVGGSRGYPTHTPLGKIMDHYGLRVSDVAARSGVYVRTMTEYLAGRKRILPHHLAALSRVLQVDAKVLDYIPEGDRVARTQTARTPRPPTPAARVSHPSDLS